MGSVTGAESDSTLKMRLTPILALIILSCLLLNFTSAQRSASRKTSKNCRGSSSRPSSSRPSSSRGSTGGRGSTRCRPNVKPTTRTTSKATSTTTSNNLKPTRRTTKKLPTKKSRGKTTRTSSRPSSSTTSSETSGPSRKPRLPTKRSKLNKTKISGTSDSSVPPTNEEGDSVSASDEERDPVSTADEESDPVSTSKRIKTKKYLGKVKDKLQSAAIWFVENKDKTLDDILVERWKEKCPGGASTKKKRKSCVSDALAESDDDTPGEKQVKDALKSLLEEDSDGAYEFLSTSSSRTFGDIEKEEVSQDISTSDNSNSSRNPSRKRLPTKRSKVTSTSGNSGSSGNNLRKIPLPKKKVKPTPSPESSSDAGTDSGSSTRRKIKTSAKKSLQKVKGKLKNAAVWYLENKDKTIDDILVDKWKEKCPGGISTKKKRKKCVSDALAESDDDTPEEKLVKDALKSLLEEDSDEAYEFLSTSSSRTFGDIEKEEETQENSTPDDSNSSRNPLRKFKLPKKKSKSTSTSGNSDSSRNPLRKIKLPKKKVKPTPSPDSPTDEETDSSRRRIKTSAKKYLQKVKDKLKVAAVWYLENKDKTIDQILVDKWKEKCPGGISTKKKRKQCVSDALADSDDDTPEEKEMKDALKSLVEEDSDAAYDFLSKSSSRTFGDIENEEEIQDKLSEMPEKYEKLWEEDKSKTFTELESEFEREKTEKMSKLSNNMKAVFSKVGGQISTKIRSW